MADNPFGQRREKILAEVEEALAKPYTPGLYKKRDQIRRKHRKKMARVESTIQTYRIYVTLECGHKTTFTLSRIAFTHSSWRNRRLECSDCAEADPAWPKGVM